MGLAFGEARAHFEPSAIEEDANAVNGEEAEVAGGLLDVLDFAVSTRNDGIGVGD